MGTRDKKGDMNQEYNVNWENYMGTRDITGGMKQEDNVNWENYIGTRDIKGGMNQEDVNFGKLYRDQGYKRGGMNQEYNVVTRGIKGRPDEPVHNVGTGQGLVLVGNTYSIL